MTTNKPGVLGYFAEYQKAGGQFRLSTNHFETRHDAVRFAFIDVRAVPVIRLSDYEALQAEFVIRLDELSARNYELRMGLAEKTSECEKLRKDAETEQAIQRAAEALPHGYRIEIVVEKDAGSVALFAPGAIVECDFQGGIAEQITDAIDAALVAHRKGGEA